LPTPHKGDFPAPPEFDQDEEREALLSQQPTLAGAAYDKPEVVESNLYGKVRCYMSRQKVPTQIQADPPRLLLPSGSH
jgi:hypothetical protein